MKQHPDGCIDWRIYVISFVVALAFACATLSPAQPIRDVKDIVGKWEGNAQYSYTGGTLNGRTTLTIYESGAWESTWPKFNDMGIFLPEVNRYSGMGWLSEGKFHQGAGHTYTLQEGGGKRVLVYAGPNPLVRAWVYPAQK